MISCRPCLSLYQCVDLTIGWLLVLTAYWQWYYITLVISIRSVQNDDHFVDTVNLIWQVDSLKLVKATKSLRFDKFWRDAGCHLSTESTRYQWARAWTWASRHYENLWWSGSVLLPSATQNWHSSKYPKSVVLIWNLLMENWFSWMLVIRWMMLQQ